MLFYSFLKRGDIYKQGVRKTLHGAREGSDTLSKAMNDEKALRHEIISAVSKEQPKEDTSIFRPSCPGFGYSQGLCLVCF